MNRSRPRSDMNQREIVANLRNIGFTVAVTSALGDGFPDICVGAWGRNFLFEIKNPKNSPSRKKLTIDEISWHTNWPGQVDVIECADDALKIMREKQ